MKTTKTQGRFSRGMLIAGFAVVFGIGTLCLVDSWTNWLDAIWNRLPSGRISLFTALSLVLLAGIGIVQQFINERLTWRARFVMTLVVIQATAGFLSIVGLLWDNDQLCNLWLYRILNVTGDPRLLLLSPFGIVFAFAFLSGYLLQLQGGKDYPFARRAGKLIWLMSTLVLVVLVTSFPLEQKNGFWSRPHALSWPAAMVFILLGLVLLASAATDSWRRWRADLDAVAGPGQGGWAKLAEYRVAAISAMLILGIVVTGIAYVNYQHRIALGLRISQLEAIADLKAGQISQWRDERRAEAVFMMQAPAVARDVKRLLNQPGDSRASSDVLKWLKLIQGGPDRYERVFLARPDGRVITAVPQASFSIDALLRSQMERTCNQHGLVYGDLRHTTDEHWRIDITAPIFDPDATGVPEVIAVIAFSINPRTHLNRMVRGMPMPSVTAETILVRREGNEIVYLSEVQGLRGKDPMRVSALTPGLVTSDLTMTDRRVIDGIDHRGEEVVAFVRRVDGTDWILLIKENVDELNRQTWMLVLLVGIIILVLIVAAIFGAGFFWRKSATAMLGRALETEQERNRIAEQLAALMRHANDIILLTDLSGSLLEANDRAVEAYGYSREELLERNLRDLTSPDAVSSFVRQIGDWQQAGTKIFETEHQRRDGHRFPVEISGRVIELGGRKHLLGILRDISQRRAHERDISRLNGLYSALSRINQAALQSPDRQTLFQTVCHVMVEHARFWFVWIGQHNEVLHRIDPLARSGADQEYADLTVDYTDDRAEAHGVTGTAVRENRGDFCNDLSADPRMDPWREALVGCRFRSAAAFPIHLNGKVWGSITVYSEEPGVFRSQEMALLGEAAGALSLALNKLEEHAARQRSEASLRESEARFRAVFDAMTECVSLHDLVYDAFGRPIDYRFLDCNRTYCDLLKRPREMILGKLASELFSVEKAPNLREYSQVALSGHPLRFEAFMEPLKRHFSLSIASPGPGRFVVVASDITQRMEAELALRDSEARFRSTFEQVAVGVAHLTIDGRWLRINERLCQLLGYSREELFAIAPRELAHPADREKEGRELERLRGGEIEHYVIQKRYRRKDGSMLWGELTMSLVRRDDGSPAFFAALVNDIGERLRMEAELVAANRELETMNRIAADCASSLALDHVANRMLDEALGISGVEGGLVCLLEPDQRLTLLAERGAWLEVMGNLRSSTIRVQECLGGKCIESCQPFILRSRDEVAAHIGDESLKRDPLEFHAAFPIVAQGKPLAVLWIFTRDSKRIPAERSMRLLQALGHPFSLAVQNALLHAETVRYGSEMEHQVQARTAQLEATNHELEAFSYSVSHDLRAPLRAIDGFARILAADYGTRLDDEARRYMGIISKESERMGRLIDDLLAFSRLGRRSLKVSDTDLGLLAKEVFAELMLREGKRSVRCTIGDMPRANVDPGLFRQVMENLLNNALKYTRLRQEAEIDVGGEIREGEVVCYVRDNGAGFDEKYSSKLFGVFQRLHSDSEFEGNGVGLALVQRIVHRHGGRVWGEGQVDRGATFYFALPNS